MSILGNGGYDSRPPYTLLKKFSGFTHIRMRSRSNNEIFRSIDIGGHQLEGYRFSWYCKSQYDTKVGRSACVRWNDPDLETWHNKGEQLCICLLLLKG